MTGEGAGMTGALQNNMRKGHRRISMGNGHTTLFNN